MKRNLKKLMLFGAALATVGLFGFAPMASAFGPSINHLDQGLRTPTRILVSENFTVVPYGAISYGLVETNPGSSYIAQEDWVQVAGDGMVQAGPRARYNAHAFKDIQFRLLGIR